MELYCRHRLWGKTFTPATKVDTSWRLFGGEHMKYDQISIHIDMILYSCIIEYDMIFMYYWIWYDIHVLEIESEFE